MLFNASIQCELFDGVNPVKRTDPIRSEYARVRRRLSEEEVSLLLQACRVDGTPQGWMWTTFFQVMLLSGLRVREAALLRWEDFFWRDSIYRPSHQKRSNGYDLLPITQELETVLACWSDSREQKGLVFPIVARYDARTFCDRARKALKGYARDAGIPDWRALGTHALRRTYITQVAEAARGDHMALLALSRHLDLETARVYLPAVSQAVRDVSAIAARAMGTTLGISEVVRSCARGSADRQMPLPGVETARCQPVRARQIDTARQLRLCFD